MNCPSRTDDTILHSEWNQNPPFLAPDLTTRQDLNGISNAREHKTGAGDGLEGPSGFGLDGSDLSPAQESMRGKSRHLQARASLTRSGRPNNRMKPSQSAIHRLEGWLKWMLSAFLMSVMLSMSGLNEYLLSAKPALFRHSSMEDIVRGQQVEYSSPVPVRRGYVKRNTCVQGGVDGRVYNTPLHVGALFIILSVSTLACAFPILATRFPRLRIPSSFLFFVSHFGTGVLIATAFVHLLPTAFTLLGDPCLSDFWTTDYPAMPGAIALGGVFLVTIIEMVFSPSRHVCGRSPSINDQEKQVSSPLHEQHDNCTILTVPDNSPIVDTQVPNKESDGSPHLRPKGPLMGRSSSFSRAINRIGEDSDRICRIASAPEGSLQQEAYAEPSYDRTASLEGTPQISEIQKYNKEVMQVFLLELGILFHSVFIGMSLSVSVGSEFVILLIAIVFHQTFEGLALGSRIASLNWPDKAIQPWLMSLAYGCTTPIGQAIGIATHTLYSPGSQVGLLLVGTMNAISAGLLIFASLVELMSEDFLSDESWRVLRGRRRVIACVLVFLGAFCMSLVGAWA